jgi:hypothetical protein
MGAERGSWSGTVGSMFVGGSEMGGRSEIYCAWKKFIEEQCGMF